MRQVFLPKKKKKKYFFSYRLLNYIVRLLLCPKSGFLSDAVNSSLVAEVQMHCGTCIHMWHHYDGFSCVMLM